MISPELLRRYPFFGFLSDGELKAIAMIAQEVEHEDGEQIIKPGQPADFLYFLMAGNCSNYFIVDERDGYKELYAGDISPGELFGISAVIEPYISDMGVQANGVVKAIKIDAKPMLTICEADPKLGYRLMRKINQVLMGQLSGAMAQLAIVK
jgi:CRP-like cAMP-binding protein